MPFAIWTAPTTDDDPRKRRDYFDQNNWDGTTDGKRPTASQRYLEYAKFGAELTVTHKLASSPYEEDSDVANERWTYDVNDVRRMYMDLDLNGSDPLALKIIALKIMKLFKKIAELLGKTGLFPGR
jgi:hypothetical protein